MIKRGLIKIDWLQARRDFCSQNPIEYVHWCNYLRSKCGIAPCGLCTDFRSNLSCRIKMAMNFLRSHGIGVKELVFTQYDITPGHDCKVRKDFINVVQ